MRKEGAAEKDEEWEMRNDREGEETLGGSSVSTRQRIKRINPKDRLEPRRRDTATMDTI